MPNQRNNECVNLFRGLKGRRSQPRAQALGHGDRIRRPEGRALKAARESVCIPLSAAWLTRRKANDLLCPFRARLCAIVGRIRHPQGLRPGLSPWGFQPQLRGGGRLWSFQAWSLWRVPLHGSRLAACQKRFGMSYCPGHFGKRPSRAAALARAENDTEKPLAGRWEAGNVAAPFVRPCRPGQRLHPKPVQPDQPRG